MEEKILNGELMSDDELDNIAGGMGYAYFAQGEQDGVQGYHIMITMNQYGTQSQVLEKFTNPNAYETFTQTQTLPDGTTKQSSTNVMIMKGFVPASRADEFVAKCQANQMPMINFATMPK